MACRNIPLSLLTWSFLTVSPSCVTNHVFGLELHAVVFFNSRKAVQQLSVLPSKIKVMILRKIASKMAVWVAWDKASSWANPIRNCKANPAKTMDAHQDVPWCLQNICTIVHKDVYLYTQSHIRVQLGSRPTSLQFPPKPPQPKTALSNFRRLLGSAKTTFPSLSLSMTPSVRTSTPNSATMRWCTAPTAHVQSEGKPPAIIPCRPSPKIQTTHFCLMSESWNFV